MESQWNELFKSLPSSTYKLELFLISLSFLQIDVPQLIDTYRLYRYFKALGQQIKYLLRKFKLILSWGFLEINEALF